MPMQFIRPSSNPSTNTTTRLPNKTFTGEAWLDLVHTAPDSSLSIGNVLFTPNARTYWHTHKHGQYLRVTAGSGWICDEGEKPKRLAVGDMVWCPPGTTHWHGAGEGSFLAHMVVTHGETVWGGEVTEEEFAKTREGA